MDGKKDERRGRGKSLISNRDIYDSLVRTDFDKNHESIGIYFTTSPF